MLEDESDYLFNQVGLPAYLKGKSGVVPLVLDLVNAKETFTEVSVSGR